ncbi:MAG TPA: lipase secretion chaperone [Kofleriaceae bacterium]
MPRRGLVAIAGAAVVVVAVLGVLTLRGTRYRSADAARARAADRAIDGAAGRTGSLAVPRFAEAAAPQDLPGSLEGTAPDGDLEAGPGGHLIVTIALRRLFDHFLAASGEEPVATMRARIIAVLRGKLPATAAAEATDVLDHYLGYRDAARAMAPAIENQDVLAELQQVHDLRARWFTQPVRDAFFADEEAALRAAVARRDVLRDPKLTDAERAARLAAIDAQLPAADREARAAATVPIDQMAREAELRARGATDAELAASRTAALGADAAQRLASLDQVHAAWDARLAKFRAARAAIAADASLSDDERQAQIAALLASSFSPPEQLRVEAIEHLPHH